MEKLDYLDSAVIRKRGRPVGKRRMPLNREQRKARNAQYERERRNVIAEATCQLAGAAGCGQSVSVATLLTSVLDLFESSAKRDPSDSIEVMKQKNEDLQKEINELQHVLSKRINDYQDDIDDDPEPYQVHKCGVKRTSKLPNHGSMKKQRVEEQTIEIKTEFDLEMEQFEVWS